MAKKESRFKFMGVVNLTPDSFSDGGNLASSEQVLEATRNHYRNGAEVFDFGAESTAPMNAPVSTEEEFERFKTYFFPIIEDVLALRKTISIDTYKPEVFKEVAQYIFSKDPSADLIWNDVSGSIDMSLIETLEIFPHVDYVFSHNLAPKRSLTQKHMDYQSGRLDLDGYFKFAIEELAFHPKLILDPCFGFSKSFEQNWETIKMMPDLAKRFNYPWLLGVSRKSFFKAISAEFPPENDLSYREILHSQVISWWDQNLPQGPYFIRLHDVALGQIAVRGQQLLT